MEIDGGLAKVLSVVKMRRSEHSLKFWRYSITVDGAVLGESMDAFSGVLTGNPVRRSE